MQMANNPAAAAPLISGWVLIFHLHMLINPPRTTKQRKALVVRATEGYKDTKDAEWLTNIILIKCRSHSKVNTLKIWEKGMAFPLPNPFYLWLFTDNEGCGLVEGVDCGLSRIPGGCVALFFLSAYLLKAKSNYICTDNLQKYKVKCTRVCRLMIITVRIMWWLMAPKFANNKLSISLELSPNQRLQFACLRCH